VINWLVLPWSAFSSPRRLCYQYQSWNHDPHSTQFEDNFEQQQDVFDDFLAENLYNEIIDSYIRDYFTNDETSIISQTTGQLLSAPEKLVADNSKVPSPVDTTSRSPYTSPVEEVVDDTSRVTSSPITSPSSSPSTSQTLSPSPISQPAAYPSPSPVDITDIFYARWEPLALEEIKEFQELEENSDVLFRDDYGDIKRNSWCTDSENHKNACDGSIGDCFTAGMEHCQKAGDSCFGVMVHPGGWTKNHKAFKICTSMSMVPKSDWWTRLKIQKPLDTQHAVESDGLACSKTQHGVESDGLELITGLSDEECVNKLCCKDWQHPWHHLCYTGPHCSEDCSECNGDPSICHNKQNAGWQRFVPDKINTSSQDSFPSSSPTSPTTSPSSSPSNSPTSSPSSSPTSSPSSPSTNPSTTVGVPTPSPVLFPYFIEWEGLDFDQFNDEWCKLEIMGRTGCEACANSNGAGKYCKESCAKIGCSDPKATCDEGEPFKSTGCELDGGNCDGVFVESLGLCAYCVRDTNMLITEEITRFLDPPATWCETEQNWSEWCVEDCRSDVQLDGVDCPFGCVMSIWICFCMIVHIYRTYTRVDEDVVEAHLEEPSIPSPQEAQEVAKDFNTPRKIEEKQTDDWEVIRQREMSDQDGYVMVN